MFIPNIKCAVDKKPPFCTKLLIEKDSDKQMLFIRMVLLRVKYFNPLFEFRIQINSVILFYSWSKVSNYVSYFA